MVLMELRSSPTPSSRTLFSQCLLIWPEASWPKIIDGKVTKWFSEVALLDQDNVWDAPKGTIDNVRKELGKALGGEVKIHEFVRFSLGEGIEKKTDDLAAEVAKLTGN